MIIIHIRPNKDKTMGIGNSLFLFNKKNVIKKFLIKQVDVPMRLAYNPAKTVSKIKKTKEIVAKSKYFFFGNKYDNPIMIKPIKPDIWLIHNSKVKSLKDNI